MLVPDPASAVGERVKLLDFGIAKLFDVSLRNAGMAALDARTRTGAILGTPAYMAPEQCMSAAQIDGQADVYSVGVIAYQMVTGRLPHDDEHPFTLMAKKLAGPGLPMGPLGEDLPSDFPQFVAAMIATKPADRPRIDQVEDTLARMLGLNASRRSGFLGRAASPDQQAAAAALAQAKLQEPTRNFDREADLTSSGEHEADTASTVDGPAGDSAALPSLPSPPWLAVPTASPDELQAPTLGPGPSTLRLAPDAASVPEPATASAPIPMAHLIPGAGASKRSRTTIGLGIVSALVVLGAGAVLSGNLRHPLPTPKPPPPIAVATPAELPKPPLPPAPELKNLPAAEPSVPINCALTPTPPGCAHAGLPSPEPSHRKPLPSRNPHRPVGNPDAPRLPDVPGRAYVIEGVAAPDQVSAIRICARTNLGSLRKLNRKSVVKLQRSGTLQITSAPPVVLQTNFDECLSQVFQSTPVKSLPEEVTIRLTR